MFEEKLWDWELCDDVEFLAKVSRKGRKVFAKDAKKYRLISFWKIEFFNIKADRMRKNGGERIVEDGVEYMF